MASTRKSVANIHRIREFELEKVHLAEEFDILQIVGEGWFGKILLVEHRATDTEMVLKALPKPYVSLRDFYREFHYGLNLGGHKNIVTTYDVAFETAGFYVFTQEYAPLGDLTSNVSETGIGELHTKRVAKQIASALDYLHARDLVHRDVKLDNILIFKSDFSRVKLCDFGESRKANALVQRRNEWLPYSPPEVLSIRTDDTYKTDLSHDIWQFGIVIFVCLTGCLPWQKAASDDPRYVRYLVWINTSFPIKRTPKLFKLISGRACKMFRKFLEPREDRRPKNLADLHKFSDDRWLAKSAEKDLAAYEPDELCPSMYSFHSNPEEKNKLLSSLALYGIETTVDRVAKKNRIREWIQTSVIAEEDEENESGTTTPSSTMSRTPVAGHVSSVRAEEAEQQKTDEQKINSTIKDASNKHIDPRTCQIQEGPSEMGSANPTLTAQMIDSNLNDKKGTLGNQEYINSFQKDRHEAYSNGNPGQIDTNHNSPIGSQTMINARLNIPLAGQGVNIQTHNEPILNLNDQSTEEMKKKLSISLGNIMNSYNKSTNNTKTTVGLISAFNSVSTVALPETRAYQNIKDSGYGSSDRIKTQENVKSKPTSPVVVKRSSFKKSSNNNYLTEHEDNPRDFDDLNDIRGSNGFVNLSGNKYEHLVHNRKLSNKMKK